MQDDGGKPFIILVYVILWAMGNSDMALPLANRVAESPFSFRV
jgi:hypothetical protein